MKLQAVNNLFETGQEEPTQIKKEMILSLYNSGTTEIETIATMSGAKPSYVGSVLHRAGLIDNYFDRQWKSTHGPSPGTSYNFMSFNFGIGYPF